MSSSAAISSLRLSRRDPKYCSRSTGIRILEQSKDFRHAQFTVCSPRQTTELKEMVGELVERLREKVSPDKLWYPAVMQFGADFSKLTCMSPQVGFEHLRINQLDRDILPEGSPLAPGRAGHCVGWQIDSPPLRLTNSGNNLNSRKW